MYKQYLTQAWNLMKQNRFYSGVYIIGTGLAISMVMVMAIAYHIRTANMAPEVNRDRTLYLNSLQYTRGAEHQRLLLRNPHRPRMSLPADFG